MEEYYEKILQAIEHPTCILRGYAGTMVAILAVARRKYLHVIYREVSHTDGFVITAFVSSKYNRRMKIWP